MASTRTEYIEGIGTVRIQKRRGAKRVSMRLHSSGEIRVSQPSYVPFMAGLAFVKSHTAWVQKQRFMQPPLSLQDGMAIGKTYKMVLATSERNRTRITNNQLFVYSSAKDINMQNAELVALCKKAIKRILTKEARELLPDRITDLALRNNYTFNGIKIKPMKSRWGSCSHTKDLTFNCYLMMLPWQIIDYVIVHELAHTKFMNHSQEFWLEVSNTVPNYKELKKELKQLQPSIHAFYV